MHEIRNLKELPTMTWTQTRIPLILDFFVGYDTLNVVPAVIIKAGRMLMISHFERMGRTLWIDILLRVESLTKRL